MELKNLLEMEDMTDRERLLLVADFIEGIFKESSKAAVGHLRRIAQFELNGQADGIEAVVFKRLYNEVTKHLGALSDNPHLEFDAELIGIYLSVTSGMRAAESSASMEEMISRLAASRGVG